MGAAIQQRTRTLNHGRRQPERHRLDGVVWTVQTLRALPAACRRTLAETWHQLTLPASVPNRYISDSPSIQRTRAARHGLSRIQRVLAAMDRGFRALDSVTCINEQRRRELDRRQRQSAGRAVNDVLMIGSKILLATDLGVVVSTDGGAHGRSSEGNLPYTSAMDIQIWDPTTAIRRHVWTRDLVIRRGRIDAAG
jgi:hypothetical protein